jgi:hypothetical protein
LATGHTLELLEPGALVYYDRLSSPKGGEDRRGKEERARPVRNIGLVFKRDNAIKNGIFNMRMQTTIVVRVSAIPNCENQKACCRLVLPLVMGGAK